MITAELIDYIKARLAAGLNKEIITKELIEVGWKQNDIEEGFKSLNSPFPSASPSEVSAPQTQALGLLSVGQSIKETISLYKRLFKKLILISLIYCLTVPLLVTVMEVIFLAGSLGAVFTAFSGFFTKNIALAAVGAIVPFIVLLLVYVLVYFITSIFTSATIYIIKEKEQISFGGALKKGFKKALPLVWTGILSGLIIAGASLVIIIPGILFAVSISLAIIVVVVEDKKGLSAISQSSIYVDRKWFYTFWRFLVFGFLVTITFIWPILLGLVIKSKVMDPIISIYSLIWILFTYPLFNIFSYVIYSSLKNYKNSQPELKKKSKTSLIIFLVIGILVIISPLIIMLVGGFLFTSIVDKATNYNFNFNLNYNYNINRNSNSNINTNRNINLNSNSNLNNNANAAVTFDDKYTITENKLSQAGLNEAEIKYAYTFADSIQQIIKNKNDENFVLENNVFKTSERAKAQYDTIKESITSKTDTTSVMDLIGLGVEAQSIERQTSQTIKTGYGYLVLTDKSVIEVYFTSAYFSKVQDLIKLVGS